MSSARRSTDGDVSWRCPAESQHGPLSNSQVGRSASAWRWWLSRPGGFEWAGHNSVAFTLTRYGGLFEDGSEAAVDRLDALLGGDSKDSDNVLQLNTRKLT